MAELQITIGGTRTDHQLQDGDAYRPELNGASDPLPRSFDDQIERMEAQTHKG